MDKFDIIITSWNRLDYLKRTVASLIQSGAVAAAERVIIVDNGSTEEGIFPFLEDLRRLHGFFLVLMPHNRGWGQAVNNVLGLSRAPYLLVCNNDVEFIQDFHVKMLEIFDRDEFNREGQPMIGILAAWRHIHHGFVPEEKGGVQNSCFREMDNVPAVAWMMPKAAMEKVGMLPEHGPCFTKGGNGEDTGYVMKMKEAGFLVGVPPEDVATHIDGY